MKRSISLLLVALACLLAWPSASAQNKAPGKAKKQYLVYGVAFYNLENLFDTINNNGTYDLEFSPNGSRKWNGQRYWLKINNLARAITNMTTATTQNGPAVIGVSEIENKSVLDDLVKAVDDRLRAEGRKPWNLQVVHHDSPDRRGVDVSCLYNPEQFKFLNVSNTTLKIESNPTLRTRDQMCVTGIIAGDTVSVIVNHWPSRLGGQEQSSYLREAAGALSKHIADSLWALRPNQGVIVMGDLNDDPHDRSCAESLGAKRDADQVGRHQFYNPWWRILDRGIGTLAYKGGWNLFDQIIVSGTLLQHNGAPLYFRSAKVNNFDFLRDTEGSRQGYPLRTYSAGVFLEGYSDHFPTEIFLVKEVETATPANAPVQPAAPRRVKAVPVKNATTLNQPDWSRNAVIYEVNWRQISGTGKIAQVEEQLPRLKELGVDILWMMPVHPISEANRKGGLGSYYAVKDYTDVNPELGNREEFKAFVKKAHDMGFKVIIDWVPNHSGCDNAWVSEHPDWYARNEQGEMFGPFDWTDVYKFDYSNPEMREAMRQAMLFWLNDMDIDGFRCDVAMEVPTDFWNETRPVLEAAKPGMFMLAEASEPDLVEHAFNMAYNWPMKDVFNRIAATAGQRSYDDKLPKGDQAAAIDNLLADQARKFAADSYLMNMITNHDLNSWEGTEFERLGNLTDAFAVLSYTLPGMPLIYTGQETGMNRAFEFFVKDVPPTFEPRNQFFDFYRTLNQLKHSHPALAAGTKGGEMVRYATTSPDLYAFSRSVGDSRVLVIVNLGNEKANLEWVGDQPDFDLYPVLYMHANGAMPAAADKNGPTNADASEAGLVLGPVEATYYPISLDPGSYSIYTSY